MRSGGRSPVRADRRGRGAGQWVVERRPMTYRIPPSLFRYVLFAAVVTFVLAVAATWAISGSDTTAVTVGAVLFVVLVVIVVRIRRLGTVITAVGIIRRGFVGDARHAWSDVHELEVIDRQSVNIMYGFQVTSRFVVTVTVGPRRSRKTLLFLDERARGPARFQDDLNTVGAMWERGRGGDLQPRPGG